MLTSLYIQNYALIEKLQVEFHSGLNIITGETGAGKSILLGALGLVLGNRADMSVLKDTDKKCVVEAEFSIENEIIKSLFTDNDIDYDAHTIIRREVNPNGKSRAFINDTPVNLSLLNDVAILFIDIHSQHQNRQLSTQSFWLNIIDKVAGINDILENYKNVFSAYKGTLAAYHTKMEDISELTREREFIEHQVNELVNAGIDTENLVELEEELSQLEHAEEIKSNISLALELLNNEQTGDLYQLNTIKSSLDKIAKVYHKAGDLSERVSSLLIELKDITDELEDAAESIDFTPERLSHLQGRVSQFYTLFQKYRVENQEELIKLRDNSQHKLEELNDGDFNLEQLKKKLDSLHNEVQKIADDLTSKRKGVFNSICSYVVDLLTDLGMPDSKMQIELSKAELTATGQDSFKVLFTANKSMPVNDINKIASGGETSRLMLAVKSLISNTSGLPAIIFDEIDTGVSGEIAHKMGNIIRRMANGMQVINITHLPQVASKGDAHFLVHKNNSGESTRTLVTLLNPEQRLHEIAKMLSGEHITDAALENARILLNS